MTSTQQKGLFSERVLPSSSVNIDYLDCSICRDLLWKPVACQTCETPFCSSCINQWLVKNQTKCPNCCAIYTERKCPPFIVKLLAQLQIACFYQSNGCEQIMSYEALDKHEIECGYQPKQCSACKVEILKKDFLTHRSTCGLVKLTCKYCKFMYKRNEADTKHTQNICLKKQIKRLKHESKESKREIAKLNSHVTEINKLHIFLTQEKITFEDLTSAVENLLYMPNMYKGLKWTGICYMHESFAIKKYPKSGYVTSFMPAGSLHIAYFSEQASISVELLNETFTLVSLTASAAWKDNLLLMITAYRNSIEVNYHNVVLLFGRPQCICLQWKNIDKVTFKPVGGTAHPEINGVAGTQVALTQLIINDLTE